MSRIFSIFLLFIYSLTSTGATVYIHSCGQNAQISIFEKQTNSADCTFCTGDHHSCCIEAQDMMTEDILACTHEHSCCTDVRVELSNGEEQALTSLFKDFDTLSPAEFIIPWIIVFHHALFDASASAKPAVATFAATTTFPNTYLVNCNFRI